MAYNSTIISKRKKCSSCGDVTYLFSRGRCKSCSTIESTNRRISQHEQKEEAESWNNIRDDLDYVYSRWVRISSADENGIGTCYTCGKKEPWEQQDNGHFIPRDNNSTRFLPQNTKPQCKTCNQYKDGNEAAFAAHLEKDGISVEWLRQVGREVVSPSISELKELLTTYRHKLKLAQLKFRG